MQSKENRKMKANFLYSAEIKGKTAKFNVNLSIIEFKDKETKTTVVYAPALKVYGYGNTVKEARESFNISLLEFFRYTSNKGTFIKEMKKLGWDIKKRKYELKLKIPEFTRLLQQDDNLSNIFNQNKKITKYEKKIPLSISV